MSFERNDRSCVISSRGILGSAWYVCPVMPRPECPLAHMARVDSIHSISFHVFHDLKKTFWCEVFCLSAWSKLFRQIYMIFMTFLFIIIIIIIIRLKINNYIYVCIYVGVCEYIYIYI